MDNFCGVNDIFEEYSHTNGDAISVDSESKLVQCGSEQTKKNTYMYMYTTQISNDRPKTRTSI